MSTTSTARNIDTILSSPPPRSLREALDRWPDRGRRANGSRAHYASPADWRDEVLYFLLPDRFSDGNESPNRLLRADLRTPAGRAAIQAIRGARWDWSAWVKSGSERFQGGTLQGVKSKLGYLQELGVTTLWIAPIFRQRVEENTYHGYAIQDFFDLDPRFGTRRDLVDLVDAAHALGLRVILDIIFNHSGCNWLYDADEVRGRFPGIARVDPFQPPYTAGSAYERLLPRNGLGEAMPAGSSGFGTDDYVWPEDLQGRASYVGAGTGNLGNGTITDDQAEFRRTDFFNLRKFNLFRNDTFSALTLVYHYWMALADHDGYRVDTFKHVTFDQARNFANSLKEYAETLGKDRFFVVAEVAGGSRHEGRYLDITGRNLDACLDIGEFREVLCQVGKGLQDPKAFFDGFDFNSSANSIDDGNNWGMGSHRNWGSQHVSISNDHDHVSGPKVRMAADADAENDHSAAAAIALQLFGLGIPCIYYGTEQGLAGGAEPSERRWLPPYPDKERWGNDDCLLRETMFGPAHPRAAGWAGTQGQQDASLPGFGPHGTAGMHVFDPTHPMYVRIQQMLGVRKAFKALRRGRQYRRRTSFLGYPFGEHGAGEILAWSRIFDDQEIVIAVNTHGAAARGARIAVDANLWGRDGLKVLLCTDPALAKTSLRPRSTRLASAASDGCTWIDLPPIGPSEVVVLANRSAVEEVGLVW